MVKCQFVEISLLIVGGTSSSRLAKAKELIQSSFDFFLIEDGSGIEEIKTLPNLLSRAPTQGSLNVCIVEEAQNLSIEAQNALLKILEEPPLQSRIILTSPSESNLLPTINSRCRIISIGKEELLLENSPDLLELTATIIKSNATKRAELSQKLDIDQYLNFWRELLLNKIGVKSTLIPGEELNKLSQQQLLKYLKKILETKEMLKENVNKKLALELLVIEAPIIN